MLQTTCHKLRSNQTHRSWSSAPDGQLWQVDETCGRYPNYQTLAELHAAMRNFLGEPMQAVANLETREQIRPTVNAPAENVAISQAYRDSGAVMAIFCYRWIEHLAIAAGAKLKAKAHEILRAASRPSDSPKNVAVQKNWDRV